MAYRQNSNPFKRKTSSPLFSKSPLNQNGSIDPENETATITSDVTTGEGGNTVRTMQRETINVVDPTRGVEKIETNNQKYLDSFNNEFKKAQESGFTGTLPEYIKQKEQNLGFKEKEEKILEERVITDTETPTEQFEEVERPKTFFEDFTAEYNFPSYERGEDRRIKIDGNEGWSLYNQPVTGKSGNTYNKINFNDERTKDWLKSEEGQNVVRGGEYMLSLIKDRVASEILESVPYMPRTRMQVEVNNVMDKYFDLGFDRGGDSSDARKYGMDTTDEKWLNMFINNPDKLQKILGRLGLDQGEGGTTVDRKRIEGTESDRTDTGWQRKN